MLRHQRAAVPDDVLLSLRRALARRRLPLPPPRLHVGPKNGIVLSSHARVGVRQRPPSRLRRQQLRLGRAEPLAARLRVSLCALAALLEAFKV